MSRLKELIEQLCPDGVRYKTLAEVTAKVGSIKWKNESGERQYIDLASVDIGSHRIVETTTVDWETAPSRARQIVQHLDVLFATTRPTQMRYCIIPEKYDGQICSTGYCVLRADSAIVDARYLCHAIGTKSFCAHVEANQTQGNYPAISDTAVKQYRIPVPPIEIQREIVRILDSMQELDDALSEERALITERVNVLRAMIYGASKYPMVALGNIGEFERGRRFTRAEMGGAGVGCVHYGDLNPHSTHKPRPNLKQPLAESRFAA